MGVGAAADPAGPGLRDPDKAMRRSGLEPSAPALAAQSGDDWRSPAPFSLYAARHPSLAPKEVLWWGNRIRDPTPIILPLRWLEVTVLWKSVPELRLLAALHSWTARIERKAAIVAWASPEMLSVLGRGASWKNLLLTSLLCKLLLTKANENSRTPLPRLHSLPLSLYPGICSRRRSADPGKQAFHGAARGVGQGWRARGRLTAPCVACSTGVRPLQTPGTVSRPLEGGLGKRRTAVPPRPLSSDRTTEP